MSQLRVVIVTSPPGASDRPDIADTFIQAEEIGGCLRALRHRAFNTAFDPNPSVMTGKLVALEPDVVFNLVEDLPEGADKAYVVPELLEDLRLPFTGAPSSALKALGDKQAMKDALRAAGLPAPSSITGTDPDVRYIVKSAIDHASLGLDASSVVTGPAEAITLMEARQIRFGGRWLAEAYIEGREFNVSLIETPEEIVTLPVAEIIFEDHPEGAPRIVGYEEKWDEASAAYRSTPRRFPRSPADQPLFEQLRAMSRAAWNLFGLKGYARVDFRVDASGNPFILEVNANPCLSASAGFCAAAAQKGLGQTNVVEKVIAAALA